MNSPEQPKPITRRGQRRKVSPPVSNSPGSVDKRREGQSGPGAPGVPQTEPRPKAAENDQVAADELDEELVEDDDKDRGV
jgi:hypothetical protein